MAEGSPIWLPLGFDEWLPAAQALTLGVMTFVQEDIPTVGAALLAAAGTLTWEVAFLGCFLGIWVGDALLYGIARRVGRPLLDRPWANRFFNPEAVVRSERWFAERGTWILISSRFVPGMRLPTYLAAGFLRLHFGRFLFVTGTAVAIWTLAIFGLAKVLGAQLHGWLSQFSMGGYALLLLAIGVVLAMRFGGRLVRRSSFRRIKAFAGRLIRWEFWPAWLFYSPVAIYYSWLAVKYRSITLPTAANPGILTGGFVGESKIATLRSLQESSPEFTADTHLVEGTSTSARCELIEDLCERHGIGYPYILKPDQGERGVGVKLIRTQEQAELYLNQTRAPLVLQRYAPGPQEAGVFYYRLPGEWRGHIFAITEKIFPRITGDGQHTIEDLIWRDERARFMAAKYLKRFASRRTEILPAGQTLKLVEAGNHAQGCIFRDGQRLRTEALEECIDGISRKLNGFFIGRYDIRYESEEDLGQGRNFQIIELNGASSEATSIYDSRNSLLDAYRILFRQWDLVFAIGATNRRRGTVPTTLPFLWNKWRENTALAATYPAAD